MKAFITASLTEEVLAELKSLIGDITYEPWLKTSEVYFNAKELAEKLDGAEIFIT